MDTTARRTAGTAARGLTAAAVLLSAVVHLNLWAVGMREVAVIGPLFALNALAGGVIALAVLLWDHWLPPLAAVGFGAATLGAYVLTATVGLGGVRGVGGGVEAVLANTAEAAAVVLGVVVLLVERGVRAQERGPAATAAGRSTRARGLTPPRPARP